MARVRRMLTMFWGGGSTAGGTMSVVIDRVLKGAKPAETPFEIITRREFVVNRRIARELGVTIPDAVLKRADKQHGIEVDGPNPIVNLLQTDVVIDQQVCGG